MNRREKITLYSNAYDLLTNALKEFPKEMRDYKPASGKWSIHEIIIHITDSEANSFCRVRKFIAEPGSTVMAYDQDEWAIKLDYSNQSIYDALQLFKLLRKGAFNIIKDEIWNHKIYHPENGEMTMGDWLSTYSDHIPIHINQMKRNFADWQKNKEH